MLVSHKNLLLKFLIFLIPNEKGEDCGGGFFYFFKKQFPCQWNMSPNMTPYGC
jgi:hypothetical protein